MAESRFVAYCSGLGLEAPQRAAVLAYLDGGHWTLRAEHTEVESGKNDANGPALAAALHDQAQEGNAGDRQARSPLP